MSIILVDSLTVEQADSVYINWVKLYDGLYTRVAQSFTGSAGDIVNAKFYLKKTGSPTGNIVVKLYSHSGNYGTTGIPDTLLATSDTIDIAEISTVPQLIIFSFSGAQQYTLEDDTKYFISIEYSGGGSSDYLSVGQGISELHSGNYSRYGYPSASWGYATGWDLIFYVYGEGAEPLEPADTIKSLPTPISLKTTQEINGFWGADMDLLPDAYVDTENYIDLPDGEKYIVKNLKDIKSGGKYYQKATLYHIAIEELSMQTVDRFDVLDSTTNILTTIIDNSNWTVGTCDITDIVAFKLDKRVSCLEAITMLAEKVNGEIDYHSDTRTVDLKRQIGTVTGLQLRYDKNLTEIVREKDSTNLITRIRPYGADNYPINCYVLDDCEDESLYTASGTGSTLASDYKKYKSIGIEMASETLNETFIRDLGASVIDLTGYTSLRFWIYSDVANTNGWTFGIGESAYTEQTVNTGALSAKSWKEVTLDLSSVADASKNAIRYIGFKNLTDGSVTAVFDFIRTFNGNEYIDSDNLSLYKVPKEYVYQHSAKLERQQITVQIYPSDDCYSEQASPNRNNTGSLIVCNYGTGSLKSFIKFDLSAIPSIATIDSATLNLYCFYLYSGSTTQDIWVKECDADWDEDTLTWNNQPSPTGTSLWDFNATSTGWKSGDVTTAVSGWFGGSDNYGLMLWTDDAVAKYAHFNSKESINKPYIEVTYTITIDPQDIIKAAAETYLYNNDEPMLRYSIKANDLSKVITNTWEDEEIALGDTVKIYDADLNLNTYVRVKKIVRDILNPTDISLELVNKSYSFADVQAKIAKQLSYAMPFKDNPNIVDANAVQVGYLGGDTNV